MPEKPVEFWIALVTGVLIVLERSRGRRLVPRAMMAAISGGIGYSVAPDIADWMGRSETIAVMISTALGYLVFDTAASFIADRDKIWMLVRSIFVRGGQ